MKKLLCIVAAVVMAACTYEDQTVATKNWGQGAAAVVEISDRGDIVKIWKPDGNVIVDRDTLDVHFKDLETGRMIVLQNYQLRYK